jgi:acyl-coenzyme A synthetase/AMP-(fatty) acid ligase
VVGELGAGQMRLGCLGKDEQERTALFVFDDAILAREKFGREKSYAVPPSTLRELIGKLGVQRGDKVALSCPNLPYFPIAYYAILKVGAAVVPFNVLFKGREDEGLLQEA